QESSLRSNTAQREQDQERLRQEQEEARRREMEAKRAEINRQRAEREEEEARNREETASRNQQRMDQKEKASYEERKKSFSEEIQRSLGGIEESMSLAPQKADNPYEPAKPNPNPIIKLCSWPDGDGLEAADIKAILEPITLTLAIPSKKPSEQFDIEKQWDSQGFCTWLIKGKWFDKVFRQDKQELVASVFRDGNALSLKLLDVPLRHPLASKLQNSLLLITDQGSVDRQISLSQYPPFEIGPIHTQGVEFESLRSRPIGTLPPSQLKWSIDVIDNSNNKKTGEFSQDNSGEWIYEVKDSSGPFEYSGVLRLLATKDNAAGGFIYAVSMQPASEDGFLIYKNKEDITSVIGNVKPSTLFSKFKEWSQTNPERRKKLIKDWASQNEEIMKKIDEKLQAFPQFNTRNFKNEFNEYLYQQRQISFTKFQLATKDNYPVPKTNSFMDQQLRDTLTKQLNDLQKKTDTFEKNYNKISRKLKELRADTEKTIGDWCNTIIETNWLKAAWKIKINTIETNVWTTNTPKARTLVLLKEKTGS
ncbi:MAG: hypothetical protein ABGW78_15750, partial [Pirellulales bacterium]